MNEFIQSVSSQLGIEESVSKDATGAALGFLKNGLGDQFSDLAARIPGAESLINESGSTSAGDEAGGLLGTLSNAASSILGGGSGESIQLLERLKGLGLSSDQIGSFVTMLIDFIKENVGEEMLQQITDKIPALKSLTS